MRVFWVVLILLSKQVQAELLESTAAGFVSQHQLVLEVPPAQAYMALTRDIHLWWDASHSYGGDAARFSLQARAGGCFCEQLEDGGSVEHMRVVRVLPGAVLTMQGGLGPLQDMAVNGSMSFVLQPHEAGSMLIYRYSVGGYTPGGLEPIAAPVDQVQLGQLQRLQKFLATSKPLNP